MGRGRQGREDEESSHRQREKGRKVRQKRRREADREKWIMRTDRAEYFTVGIFHTSHNISFLPSDSRVWRFHPGQTD